jgi:hypothetical protein
MPSNRASNDLDLVQPTQYIVPPNRTAKKPPPKPWPLPKFEPLHIDALTASGARQTRKVFGDEDEKDLPIPSFIYYYNCYMYGVDIADQLRSYYNTQRIHRKTWKPLFHFLLDTVLGNCYQLSSYKPLDHRAGRKDTHKQFRKDLRYALFERLSRNRKQYTQEPPPRRSTNEIKWYLTKDHKLIRLWTKPHNCSACIETGRKTQLQRRGRRKALAELSSNYTKKSRDSDNWKRPQRTPRTQFGCSVCQIPFCRKDECWKPHIQRLNSKD